MKELREACLAKNSSRTDASRNAPLPSKVRSSQVRRTSMPRPNVTGPRPGMRRVIGCTRTERTPGLLAARAKELGITPDGVEKRDYADDSPRGNAINRMVDAAEVAYVTAFLASDKAWAVTGELVVASGGQGRSVYY